MNIMRKRANQETVYGPSPQENEAEIEPGNGVRSGMKVSPALKAALPLPAKGYAGADAGGQGSSSHAFEDHELAVQEHVEIHRLGNGKTGVQGHGETDGLEHGEATLHGNSQQPDHNHFKHADQGAREPDELCLLAGKIMLQSGAETYRVEDTMTRMAEAMGLKSSHSYVTPTGIMFQPSSSQSAKLIRIVERTTDLEKIAAVNDVSRKLGTKDITPADAHARLIDIEGSRHEYPMVLQIATAAVASGCFTYMFRGGMADILPGVLCGGAGFAMFLALHRLIKVKFFAEFSASFLIGLLAVVFVALGIGQELDKIIIGSVMPLVPGLLITNAVRDLMAGHLVSGLSRGAEAFLTAFAIGAGIAVVVTFF